MPMREWDGEIKYPVIKSTWLHQTLVCPLFRSACFDKFRQVPTRSRRSTSLEFIMYSVTYFTARSNPAVIIPSTDDDPLQSVQSVTSISPIPNQPISYCFFIISVLVVSSAWIACLLGCTSVRLDTPARPLSGSAQPFLPRRQKPGLIR